MTHLIVYINMIVKYVRKIDRKSKISIVNFSPINFKIKINLCIRMIDLNTS